MKYSPIPPLARRMLFLQGPPGPMFRLLGARLAAEGWGVNRINLSGGDRSNWNDRDTDDYRGSEKNWPLWLDRYLVENAITHLMLFGDCRPYHEAARRIAIARNVTVYVLEEGYIRPHWMTLEKNGVNANSQLPRDPDWFVEQARSLPPVPEPKPITATLRRRARDGYWYYHRTTTQRWRYPFFRHHRPGSIFTEAFGWARRYALRNRRKADTDRTIEGVLDKPFFLFPMQLGSDYQIRRHSPFPDMESGARYVIESFARAAPAETHLLVKAHPLDFGSLRWPRLLRNFAEEFEVTGRVHFIDGGNLAKKARQSLGMVCVNSTSGTLALAEGTPVKVLGDAVYDIPMVTDQQHIDDFWSNPRPPDADVWDAFHRVLLDRVLVHGGIASKSAVDTLIDSIVERIERDECAEAMLDLAAE